MARPLQVRPLRFGAGTARLRNPHLQAVLEPALGRLAGWGLPAWYAVRRRFNKAADRLAGIACQRAAPLRVAGQLLPVQYRLSAEETVQLLGPSRRQHSNFCSTREKPSVLCAKGEDVRLL